MRGWSAGKLSYKETTLNSGAGRPLNLAYLALCGNFLPFLILYYWPNLGVFGQELAKNTKQYRNISPAGWALSFQVVKTKKKHLDAQQLYAYAVRTRTTPGRRPQSTRSCSTM